MNSINIMGRLVRDPDLKDVNDTQVAKTAIAWSERKDGPTAFFDIEAWGRQRQLLADYFHKGDGIGITGKLTINEWETRDGQKRTTPVIRVSEITFMMNRKERAAQPDPEPAAKPRKTNNRAMQAAWRENAKKNNEALDAQTFEPVNIDDGDLPF